MVRSERLEWEQDEVTVYADGYDADTASEFETLEIPGVVVTAADADEGNAWRLGRYHLAQAILRPETFEWHADWEHMRVTRGDKVQLVHDVPVVGIGAARVKSMGERIGWGFRGSVDGWVADQASLTPSANGIVIEPAGQDPKLIRRGLGFSGGRFNRVVLDVERVADRTGGAWDGRLFWSTQGGHGASSGFLARFPDLAAGTRRRIVLDMAQPDQGGSDWISSIITELRIDFDNGPAAGVSPGGAWRIHGISVISDEVSDIATAASGTFIELDELFDMAADQFRLTARAEDGSRHSALAQAPVDPETRLWQIAGEVVPGTIQRGDLVFIEEVAQESMEVLVTGVFPDGDSARITAVPAAPAVLLADQEAVPSYNPIITSGRQAEIRGPDLPVVLSIRSDEATMIVDPDGAVSSRLGVMLEPVPSAGVLASVQLRWRPAGGDDPWVYGMAQPVGNTEYLTEPVQRGTVFEVGVRTISGVGRTRGWVHIGTVLAQGTDAPPPAVTGLVIVPIEQQVQLRWDAVTDIPDLTMVEIRYSASAAASWNASVLLERIAYPMVTARLFARAGTYLLKWVDREGRYSPEAASAYISEDQIRAQNAVEVLECSPAWVGTFADTGKTVLDMLILKQADGVYPAEGTWTNSTVVDPGAIYPVQITAHIEAGGFSSLDAMSEWTSLAALPALAASNPEGWRIETEVRVSDGGSTWSGWQEISGGDFLGRHFSFRVRLISLREDVTPRVDMLAFVLDMPDRVAGADDVTCPSGGMSVSYEPAF